MPYASKAIVQHEYEGTTLFVWLEFCLPMKLSSDPLATPPVFDVKPPDAKWLVELDEVLTPITSSEWLDLFTMLLTIEAVASEPDKVTVEYDGPHPDLRTAWNKQWEPFGPIFSINFSELELQPGTFKFFHDRGDPAEVDFDINDFIIDQDWHTQDLSSVVPQSASAVLFSIEIRSTGGGSWLKFRKYGNQYQAAVTTVVLQVDNNVLYDTVICSLDSTRKIEYMIQETEWDIISLVVLGWFF